MTVGDVIVLALIVVVAGFAVRSLHKTKKSGGGCTGDCSSCGGCGCHTQQKRP